MPPTSQTAAAVAWIQTLPFGSWFWVRDVPAEPHIARPVLSRLCRNAAFGLRRAGGGLYWRGYPEGHEHGWVGPNHEIAALHLAGPGAGLARWNALNRLGWTAQVDPQYSISVLGRRPKPDGARAVRHYPSDNQRRQELNWSEVTLLEALGLLAFVDGPWADCVDFLASGGSATRFDWHFETRPERLLWAAETETGNTVDLVYRLEQIAEAVQSE